MVSDHDARDSQVRVLSFVRYGRDIPHISRYHSVMCRSMSRHPLLLQHFMFAVCFLQPSVAPIVCGETALSYARHSCLGNIQLRRSNAQRRMFFTDKVKPRNYCCIGFKVYYVHMTRFGRPVPQVWHNDLPAFQCLRSSITTPSGKTTQNQPIYLIPLNSGNYSHKRWIELVRWTAFSSDHT